MKRLPQDLGLERVSIEPIPHDRPALIRFRAPHPLGPDLSIDTLLTDWEALSVAEIIEGKIRDGELVGTTDAWRLVFMLKDAADKAIYELPAYRD